MRCRSNLKRERSKASPLSVKLKIKNLPFSVENRIRLSMFCPLHCLFQLVYSKLAIVPRPPRLEHQLPLRKRKQQEHHNHTACQPFSLSLPSSRLPPPSPLQVWRLSREMVRCKEKQPSSISIIRWRSRARGYFSQLALC